MQEIRLETSDGRYVVTGIIPLFITPPEIVIWGTRYFKLFAANPGLDVIYREAFTVAVVEYRFDK